MMPTKQDPITNQFRIIFGLIIILNMILWFYARPLQAKWENVPPAPSDFGIHAIGLGDPQLSYRASGLMLQNLGSVGGRAVALRNYDYESLKGWFFEAYDLDRRAGYIPTLAAYYYGAVDDPAQLVHIVDFLEVAGENPREERWRWLVHAVFIAQHKMKDLDRALEIALRLKTHQSQSIPLWARHMDAMIRNTRGEKEDAEAIMREILASTAETLPPSETLFIMDYLCNQILDETEKTIDPICALLPF